MDKLANGDTGDLWREVNELKTQYARIDERLHSIQADIARMCNVAEARTSRLVYPIVVTLIGIGVGALIGHSIK